jgi:RHS repeat-associated protein
VLEALIDAHSEDAAPDQDQIISADDLMRLKFTSIVVQPGDALYVEYRGKDFKVAIKYDNGDFLAFDSSPKASDEQWRKGILPLDQFRAGLRQRLTTLNVTGVSLAHVFFRNLRIVRAGRPVFEFASLASYGKPQIRSTIHKELPCKAFDEEPALPQPLEARFSTQQTPQATGQTPAANNTAVNWNHFKYTGQELDAETGLYHMGARYYSPGVGRFTSPDPLLIKVDRLLDPQRLNLYAYARNNPTTNRDPSGQDLVAGTGDQKAIKSALKEIASRPGGRAFLTKMDNLTQTIRLSTGTGMTGRNGQPEPGRTAPAQGADTHFVRTRDNSGKITDVSAPNLDVTIDPKLGKQMRDSHDPNAPASDAELIGHELKHAEFQDFQEPNSETLATEAIDAILAEPADKDLRKSADQFVDDLLKPNSPPTPTPSPTPAPEPKNDKEPN